MKYMKYIKVAIALVILSASLFSCTRESNSVVKTYEVTDPALVESYFDEGKTVTIKEYYEMSDGTYVTDDGNVYKYRHVITGRMHAAARDSSYIILSNRDDITFDQAWKAAGYSSNLEDYFDPKESMLVGIG